MTGVFFCFGAIAWLIRVLLLAMMRPLTWLNVSRTSSSYGANWVGTGRSSSQQQQYSLFSSSPGSTAATQRQQLPGCARVVPASPGRQSPGDGRRSNVARVYGTPVTYADAVTSHGGQAEVTEVLVGEGVAAGVLKSPRRGGQAGGNGSGSATGRVRFADDVL